MGRCNRASGNVTATANVANISIRGFIMARSIKHAKAKGATVTKANGKAKGAKSRKAGKSRVVAREYQPKPGTGLEFTPETRIIKLPTTNPKRGASAKRFQAYLTKKPKTVAAAIAAGLTNADIRWDAGKGFIKLGK